MRKLNCIIIDDEEMATRVIDTHLSHVDDMEVVGIFHSGVEAFLALDTLEVDVLFLDIQMPKITGLSMLKMLKNPPLTVLTTAYRDYAVEGFDLDVVDYLLKPISLDRFLQTVSKIRRLTTAVQPSELDTLPTDHVFVRVDRTFIKVLFEEILFVESIRNHIRIVTADERLLTLMPLSEFESKLPEGCFIRLHRSFIVNKRKIESFNSSQIQVGNEMLPIGRSYREQVKLELEGI